MPPPSDSFLDGDRVTDRPTWASIIQHSAPELVITSPASPIIITCGKLWGLQFSSDQNVRLFGPVAQGNNASTLNDAQDAVFALVPPTIALNISFATIKAQFGILPGHLSADFDVLVGLVDANGPVSFVLDGAEKARSALWVLSGTYYRSIVNLVFRIPEIASVAIKTFISSTFGLAVEPTSSSFPFRLTIRWTTAYTIDSAAVHATSQYQVTLDVPLNSLLMSFIFTPLGTSVRVSNPSDTERPTGSLFARLNTAFLSRNPSPSVGSGDLLDSGLFDQFFGNIKLWYIDLSRSIQKADVPNAEGDIPAVFGPIEYQINCIADWKSSNGVIVALRYDSRRSAFAGKLLLNLTPSPDHAIRQYDYDWQTDISWATYRALRIPIDVWQLLDLKGSAPSVIPHMIASAGLELTKVPNGYTLALDATLHSSSSSTVPGDNVKEAPHGFNWDFVSLNALYSQFGSQQSLAVGLCTQMTLHPKEGSNLTPAMLMVRVEYQTNGSWILYGQVSDLNFALLYSYLPLSVRESALKVFERINLKYVSMLYTFHPVGDGEASTGKASSFFISAVMDFGDLELALSYEYASTVLPAADKPASQIFHDQRGTTPTNLPVKPIDNEHDVWTFTASLSSISRDTNIGNIINTLIGKNLIPDSIAHVPIPANGGGLAMKLALRGDGAYTAMSLLLDVGDISVTLVNLITSEGTVGSTGTNNPSSSKTILRVSLDEIPIIPAMPLIQVLPMPFDNLLYLWLDDDSDKGLYDKELAVINDELAYLSIAKIGHKDISKDPALPVIRAGHHFMVLDKGTVIVDHCFTDAEAKPPAQPPTPDPQTPVGEDEQESPPTKGALDKKLPFLSISALSLMFKNGSIGVEFDATVRLGPIDFTLLQFDVGIDLLQIADISHLKEAPITADIHGLAISMDAPPVTLSGVFMVDRRREGISYRGGVSLGFQAWSFLAVGEYAVLNHGNFKSVFVYAKLMGPLMTIGFASVTGIRMGLGYNSAVRSPAIKELPTFPFLTDSVDHGNGDDPLAIIQSMTDTTPSGPPWVMPKHDAYWMAAVSAMFPKNTPG
jgi:hypothetical protein